jgi:hypothetical protein
MTNCHSRLLFSEPLPILSIRDRLKRRLVPEVGEEKYKIVHKYEYLAACDVVPRLFEQYKLLARDLLSPVPEEKLVNSLQTISLWEQRKGHNGVDHKHAEYMKTLKSFWPNWNLSSAHDAQHDGMVSPADRLYGDTLQSVLMFLEATELAACMMVSRSWMAAAKRPLVWVGKVLWVADHVAPGMNALYTAPWAGLALKYVEGVVVVSSRPNYTTYGVFQDTRHLNTYCYNQLQAVLGRKALPNLRRVCMLNIAASALAMSLAGNPYIEEIVVGDNVTGHSVDRHSLLQSMPNLRVARLQTFHEMCAWYYDYFDFCKKLSESSSIQHLVLPIEMSENRTLPIKLEVLYEVIAQHPSLKTLELQIYGKNPATCIVATILEQCKGICANIELLHIRQLERQGYDEMRNNRSTLFYLAMIKKTLLTTVLLEKSKMHVKIELIARNKIIKYYRNMLRELPADAAEIANKRISISIATSPAKEGSLLHLA